MTDNITHCGLCSTDTSGMERAKYNQHGQAKYNDDGRCHVPVTSVAL